MEVTMGEREEDEKVNKWKREKMKPLLLTESKERERQIYSKELKGMGFWNLERRLRVSFYTSH